MGFRTRDWTRMTECYRMVRRDDLARTQGRPSTADRFQRVFTRLNSHFLPHYSTSASVPQWRLRVRGLGGPRVLPDFACIGATKTGSTDLSAYLLQHPCILPPLAKEILSTNPRVWRRYYPTVREKQRVAAQRGKALSGYFTPVMHNVRLIDNFHAARPDAKIILLLRNPADRAPTLTISGSCFTETVVWPGGPNSGHSPTTSRLCSICFRRCRSRLQWEFRSCSPGVYVKAVQRWCDRFGRENVQVVRSEDFFDDIASTVCEIHEFLENPSDPTGESTRLSTGTRSRHRLRTKKHAASCWSSIVRGMKSSTPSSGATCSGNDNASGGTRARRLPPRAGETRRCRTESPLLPLRSAPCWSASARQA
nr:hypothetical protein Hi04_10k_c1889_00013 [uncultured bacterium]